MAENKVCFNLKNVHYSVLTESIVQGVKNYTYATPVAVSGAVSLSLSAQGDDSKFYADGGAYYVTYGNTGYSGDLEMARFPDQMLEEIWGYNLDSTSKVLADNTNAEPVPFALLFQIDGDQTNQKYCLYKCTASRPDIAGDTNTESKEVKTQTCTITAVPLDIGISHARTTHETTSSVDSAWFTSVFAADTTIKNA